MTRPAMFLEKKNFLLIFFITFSSSVSLGSFVVDDLCIGQNDNVMFADPLSCEGFYQCLEEIAIHGECPYGRYYDARYNICNYPNLVNCSLKQEEENEEEEYTTEMTTVTTTKSFTTTLTNALPVTDGNIEPGIYCPPAKQSHDPSEKPLFIPSNIDCEKYYLCYYGRPVPLHCLKGMHWNQLEYFCDDPYYAHCKVNPDSNPNPFPDCPRRGKHFIPHKTNCEYYIYCYEGIGQINRCPYYYGWDIEHEQCVIRSMAKCFNSQ